MPNRLARRAKQAGLLSDSSIGRLLEESMRCEAARQLMEVTERPHAANIEPMGDDENAAEVKAARAERFV